MAAKYISITSGDRTTLLEKNTNNTATQYTGLISSIRVSNNDTDLVTVAIWIEDSDGDKHFFIKNLVVPGRVAFEFNDNISFNVNTHKLVIDHTADTTLDLTVRIE